MAEITPFITVPLLYYVTASLQSFPNVSTIARWSTVKAAFFREWQFSHHRTLLSTFSTADLASHSEALTSYVRVRANESLSWEL